ncbi:RNA polymerase ECF-type sigma factor [hydrothermal vent metagenome]|uniref:RNA polymerase ECF-type sigma factor n=1 Tax=hydrothermal vent metagenome TaxID=652676 RepID=A0A3B0VYC2_9ZZZZ
MKNRQDFFEKLVSAYAKDLYRYAYWLCKQPTVAEDLVQETFTRAWKAIDRLKDEKAAKAWLITILRRENARLYEKYQPPFSELDEGLVAEGEQYEPLPMLEKSELQQFIMKLPNDYREPMVLQIVWGFSGEEIATQLNLKLATVNTRLFRARQKLKEMVQEKSKSEQRMLRQKGGRFHE